QLRRAGREAKPRRPSDAGVFLSAVAGTFAFTSTLPAQPSTSPARSRCARTTGVRYACDRCTANATRNIRAARTAPCEAQKTGGVMGNGSTLVEKLGSVIDSV